MESDADSDFSDSDPNQMSPNGVLAARLAVVHSVNASVLEAKLPRVGAAVARRLGLPGAPDPPNFLMHLDQRIVSQEIAQVLEFGDELQHAAVRISLEINTGLPSGALADMDWDELVWNIKTLRDTTTSCVDVGALLDTPADVVQQAMQLSSQAASVPLPIPGELPPYQPPDDEAPPMYRAQTTAGDPDWMHSPSTPPAGTQSGTTTTTRTPAPMNVEATPVHFSPPAYPDPDPEPSLRPVNNVNDSGIPSLEDREAPCPGFGAQCCPCLHSSTGQGALSGYILCVAGMVAVVVVMQSSIWTMVPTIVVMSVSFGLLIPLMMCFVSRTEVDGAVGMAAVAGWFWAGVFGCVSGLFLQPYWRQESFEHYVEVNPLSGTDYPSVNYRANEGAVFDFVAGAHANYTFSHYKLDGTNNADEDMYACVVPILPASSEFSGIGETEVFFFAGERDTGRCCNPNTDFFECPWLDPELTSLGKAVTVNDGREADVWRDLVLEGATLSPLNSTAGWSLSTSTTAPHIFLVEWRDPDALQKKRMTVGAVLVALSLLWPVHTAILILACAVAFSN